MHAVGNHRLAHATRGLKSSFGDSYPGHEMIFALRNGDSNATRKRGIQDGRERNSIHGLKDERARITTVSDACADPDSGQAEFGDHWKVPDLICFRRLREWATDSEWTSVRFLLGAVTSGNGDDRVAAWRHVTLYTVTTGKRTPFCASSLIRTFILSRHRLPSWELLVTWPLSAFLYCLCSIKAFLR